MTHIAPLHNVVLRVEQRRIVLPKGIQHQIDTYWDKLLNEGHLYTRGSVFTITREQASGTMREIWLVETDYAHYLYDRHVGGLGAPYTLRIPHAAAWIETADDRVVFGKMGEHTAHAGVYQCCAGGFDADDVRGGVVDVRGNIQRELQEELGIDLADAARVASFEEAYTVSVQEGEREKITMAYCLRLRETADQFLERYHTFAEQIRQQGQHPEFDEVLALAAEDFTSFISKHAASCAGYLPTLCKKMMQDRGVE